MYSKLITALSAEDTKFSSLSFYHTSFLENKECKREVYKKEFISSTNPILYDDMIITKLLADFFYAQKKKKEVHAYKKL